MFIEKSWCCSCATPAGSYVSLVICFYKHRMPPASDHDHANHCTNPEGLYVYRKYVDEKIMRPRRGRMFRWSFASINIWCLRHLIMIMRIIAQIRRICMFIENMLVKRECDPAGSYVSLVICFSINIWCLRHPIMIMRIITAFSSCLKTNKPEGQIKWVWGQWKLRGDGL